MSRRLLILTTLLVSVGTLCIAQDTASPPAPPAAPATNAPAQPPPAAEPPVNPAWKHEIQIEVPADSRWGCPEDNLRAVAVSAASELLKYFPDRKMPPIKVFHESGRPIYYFNAGPDRHVNVFIASGDYQWSQVAYQFAHEYCHVLCSPHKGRGAQHWFQETLCETASRFALNRMSETWKTSPPYYNWAGYSASLKSYFDNLQNNNRLPPGQTLGQWYRENTASCTYITPVISAEMYDMLSAEPEHWEILNWYPRAANVNPDTLEQFLRAWRNDVPENHKAFITAIARRFEYDLDKPAPAAPEAAATNATAPEAGMGEKQVGEPHR